METDQEQSSKKVRKRYKHLFKQIRAQMEFYFSDANLQKDRYVKKLMDESEDKWIPLEAFKNFNKLRSITEDMSLVARALASSELIEVNETKDKIRRTRPVAEPKDLDARTIYVEGLPLKVDHDWVKSVFSSYGRVTYVSLPRFRSTGDFKGFGFVEFQDEEEAKLAVREHSAQSTDKKVGIFPSGSKQMKQVIKQAVAHNIPLPDTLDTQLSTQSDTESGAQPDTEPATKNEKKRTHSDDDDEEEEEETKVKKLKTEHEADSSGEMSDSSKKEKKEEVSESEEKAKTSKKRKKDRKEDEEEVEVDEKTKKKKKKKKKEEGKEDEGSEVDSKKGVKRKVEDEEESVSPKKQKIEEPEKKKNRKKKKKFDKPEEEVKLKVLSKAEWLELRNEYLAIQKANMSKLKESLRKTANPPDQTKAESSESKKPETATERGKRGLEFVPDVLLTVTSKFPLERKRLKEVLSEHGEVSYIDIIDEDSKAIVRCPTPFNAKSIVRAEMNSYHCCLLEGEEEKQYWDKIMADREKKLNSTKQKVRGKDRINNKALERTPAIETIPKERKKVYFFSPYKKPKTLDT